MFRFSFIHPFDLLCVCGVVVGVFIYFVCPLSAHAIHIKRFSTNVAAVVEKLLEKDKNLNEETNYLWARTLDGSFDFDRRAQEAAAVKTLDKVKRKGGFLLLLKKFANATD